MKTRILIFGAHGQLGHDLRRLLSAEHEIVGVGHNAVDITDALAVEKKTEEIKPNIVINVAAYNKVEEAEHELLRAYQVNALGAYYIAAAAMKIGAPVLHVSSDYVFPGTKRSGYKEDDETDPLNIYGASKEAGEKLVRIGNPQHWIIRTSALFGVNSDGGRENGKGRNFVTQMLARAEEGGQIKVVADQWTSPTYTLDLANGIRALLLRQVSHGTYHLVNEGSTTWYDFAREIFRITGHSPHIERIATQESGTAINRPKRSLLLNQKLKKTGIMLPPWQDALRRYIIELGIAPK